MILYSILSLANDKVFVADPIEMDNLVRIAYQLDQSKTTEKPCLSGEWEEFYVRNEKILHQADHSEVMRLLSRLNEENFPILPDAVYFEDGYPDLTFFDLAWTSRFYVHLPCPGTNSFISLGSTSGGPTIKFCSVEHLIDHLLENRRFYEK